MRRLRLLSLLAPSLLAVPAMAQTGLVRMPIADILKHREGVFELESAGAEHGEGKRYEFSAETTVGLFDRIEIGGETNFLGNLSGNVKFLLFEDPKQLRKTALSVGLTDIRNNLADPYVVGRFDGKGYRLHAGAWRTEGTVRGMFGSDFPVLPGVVGTLEYVGGPNREIWGSLTYSPTFAPGFELGLSLGEGIRSEGLHIGTTISYSFKF